MTTGHKLAEELSGSGYRLTPQRMMILEQVEAAEGHISAEEILKRILPRYPALNVSTVYRTLELLKAQGLVTETDMGDGIRRFHAITQAHHHHLVCRSCGKVTELDEGALLPLCQTLKREYGFKAEMHHLAIFGYCAHCLP